MTSRSAFDGLPTAERFYRSLLWVYPATYRREYGALMTQLFRDLRRDAYRRAGRVGVVGLWGRILTELAVTAIVEHIHTLQEGERTMSKQQHWLILSLAGLPLWLGIFLLLLNPIFMRQMVVPNAAQPLGWLMTAAILGLTVGAYVMQRKALLAAATDTSAGVTQDRRFLRSVLFGPLLAHLPWRHGVLFVGSVLFLVLPALLLVLLGPALLGLLMRGILP